MTEPPNDRLFRTEEEAYLERLGIFVESYALFEAALFDFAQITAGLDREIAIIFLSGLNVDRKIEFIRRVWLTFPPATAVEEEIEDVFSHAKPIQTVRNSMLHYGSFLTPEKGRVTSDISRALVKAEAKVHRVSAERLTEMNFDILKCASHLISLVVKRTSSLSERAEAVPILARAWFYTPDTDQPRKSRKSRRKRRKP